MAWKDTLLEASFRGVPFEVQHVNRSGQRALSVNEYPYRAGADLEDLNLRPRRVKVKAVFYKDGYEDALHLLVQALEAPGAAELIHPVHGSMTCMAESWEDDHEADNVDGAVLSMTFVEHSTRDVVFTAQAASAKTDAVAAQVAAARAAADDAMVRRVGAVPASNALRITVLKDLFNQAKTALGQLLAITNGVKLVLSGLDPLLYPRAYAGDLLAMVDRALQGMPFGGRNLLFDSASGAAVVAGSGLANFKTAQGALDPARMVLTPGAAAPTADMLADAAALQAHARVHGACALAECAAIVLAGELDTPLLDRIDVELMTNAARTALQVAMTSARSALDAEGAGKTAQALAALAYALQEAARAVISQKPPLTRQASPVAGPVRLVAHALYGDPDRADELVRLNRLGRRALVEQGEVLYAYAR